MSIRSRLERLERALGDTGTDDDLAGLKVVMLCDPDCRHEGDSVTVRLVDESVLGEPPTVDAECVRLLVIVPSSGGPVGPVH